MFRFAKLQFEIQLLDAFPPTEFLGSRLRGGYGLGLLAQLCRQSDPLTCANQWHRCECDYGRLFRPTRETSGRKIVGAPLRDAKNLPAPFVIDSPAFGAHAYRAGERVLFGFGAIGPMCDLSSAAIRAVEEFGKLGLILNPHRRAHFRLLTVRDLLDSGREIYDAGKIRSPVTLNITEGASLPGKFGNELLIRFLTPTRIENENARQKDRETGLAIFADFYDFVYNATQRVAGLWQMYGEDWPGPAEFYRWRERLLKQARQVETIDADLTMMRLCGYSNLQEEDKPLDGFVGSMQFRGDFSPFIDVLRIAELVHIGAETTAGLGQFRMIDNMSPQ